MGIIIRKLCGILGQIGMVLGIFASLLIVGLLGAITGGVGFLGFLFAPFVGAFLGYLAGVVLPFAFVGYLVGKIVSVYEQNLVIDTTIIFGVIGAIISMVIWRMSPFHPYGEISEDSYSYPSENSIDSPSESGLVSRLHGDTIVIDSEIENNYINRASVSAYPATQLEIGKTCPYCQYIIKPNTEVVVCPACQTPHHKECWDENGGCTTYGCKYGGR